MITFRTFFSHYIFYPQALPNKKEQHKAIALSILCGVLSIGLIHAVCAAVKYFQNRKVKNQTQNNSNKSSSIFEKIYPKESISPPQNILNLIKEQIIQKNKVPSNSIEYFFDAARSILNKPSLLESLGLTSDGLLQIWNNRNDITTGANSLAVNVMFDAYFSNTDHCACVRPSSYQYLGKTQTPKIAYFPIVEVNSSFQSTKEYVKRILQGELSAHSNHRPEKIFIPMAWQKNNIIHFTLLVVEPNQNNTRVTMINTHGDSLETYLDFELAAMETACEVYHVSINNRIRNKNTIYSSSYSCSHDIVDIARQLAQIENVHNRVKIGLDCKTKEQDILARIEHANQLAKFYATYSNI